MSRRKNRNINTRSGLSAYLRRPAVQLGLVAFIILVIFLIAQGGGGTTATLSAEVNADAAYQMVQDGAFMLDVRTQEEWDEYHAPMATLIPLDQLQARLNELPKDKEVLVVCRSGNRSGMAKQLLDASGFTNVRNLTGGLLAWQASFG